MALLLVAEDNVLDAFLLQRAVLKFGVAFDLRIVRDGQEVIDYLQGIDCFSDRSNHPLPNLLITDLKMPRLDGFDVLIWLRKQPGLRRIPTVVFSSSSLLADVNRAYDLGANSFLLKPMDYDEWEIILRSIEHYWTELNVAPDCQAA